MSVLKNLFHSHYPIEKRITYFITRISLMNRIIVRILISIVTTLVITSFFFFEKKSTGKSLTLYGNIDIRQIDLAFELSGRVAKMIFEEGDSVKKGEVVGEIDKRYYENRVLEAQSALVSAHYAYKNAEQLVDRRKIIQEDGAISQEEYTNAVTLKNTTYAKFQEATAQLKIAQKNLSDTELCAPSDGTILTRVCEPGTMISPGIPIYTLSVLSPIAIRAYISEPELGIISHGMKVEVTTDTATNKIYHGHIGFISPVAEFTPKTVQTTSLRADLVYRIRVIVDDADCFLKQGMPVSITVLP